MIIFKKDYPQNIALKMIDENKKLLINEIIVYNTLSVLIH